MLLFALVLGMSGTAFAQSEQILHVSGHAYEDGGFPSSNVGDFLSVLFILNDIEDPLVWDTANYNYSGQISQLLSLGEAVFGTTHVASYSGGLFTIYVDWLPSNHDYGINPPNATAPSTFTDGISTYLDGFFTDFTLTYNSVTASGSFSGSLNFTGGDVFPLLTATEGWTFGANVAGFSPEGYDLQINGDVFLSVVSVEDESWGGIKSLYR
ncbi:MAG: hypothetical protein DHS20C21_00810 [Gemmatimonadota bacterium]|nr:MAG: hypothetical protein DHS20C21_00810 [Gemmatimonadota bacterium]